MCAQAFMASASLTHHATSNFRPWTLTRTVAMLVSRFWPCGCFMAGVRGYADQQARSESRAA